MAKDVTGKVLSIIEEHCWKHTVQDIGDPEAVLGFTAGRNAALGEIADLIRQLRGIYKIAASKKEA